MSTQAFAPGRYRGRMVAAHLGKSKEKGTPQIAFEFEPIGKYSGGDELEACASDQRTVFKYLTENTVDSVIANLRSLTYDRETFAEIDADHPNAFPFAGIEFDVVLKFEQYNGQEKERWDFPLKGIGGKPMESTEVKELDARFGAGLKMGQNGNTSNASRAPVNRPAERAAAAAANAKTEAEAFDRF